MSRYKYGWVKMHRKLLDNVVSSDLRLLGLWSALLLYASYKKSEILDGNDVLGLKPGDIVTSITGLSKDLGSNPKTIKVKLGILKKLGMITTKNIKIMTIISICNWEEYQSLDDKSPTKVTSKGNDEGNDEGNDQSNERSNERSNEQSNEQSTHVERITKNYNNNLPFGEFEEGEEIEETSGKKSGETRTTRAQGLTEGVPSEVNSDGIQFEDDVNLKDISQEAKKGPSTAVQVKKNTEVPKGLSKSIKRVNEPFLEVAANWLGYAKSGVKSTRVQPSWTVDNFANELRKINRNYPDLTPEGLGHLLTFIKSDDFWAKQCFSPAGLMKISKTNDLRKIDNVINSMKPQKTAQQKKRDENQERVDRLRKSFEEDYGISDEVENIERNTIDKDFNVDTNAVDVEYE